MLMSKTMCKMVQAGVVVAASLGLIRSRVHADLLLFYDFNDASNPNAVVDISGNGNHAEVFDAEFTSPGGGRTGGGDDRALDFLGDQDEVFIEVPTAEAGAFDSITDNDAATIAMWVFGGEDQPQNNFVFWFADGDTDPRQLGAHIPWSNGQIFFDVAGCCQSNQRIFANEPDDTLWKGDWNHYAFVKDGEWTGIYQNGDLWLDTLDPKDPVDLITTVRFGSGQAPGQWSYNGLMDDIGVWNEALSEEQIQQVMTSGVSTVTRLRAGDADQDLDFDQLDLVRVQVAGKYLTGQPATWGEGDWDGAPGGSQGSPPQGDGMFNQLDIISALNANIYLTGPYTAVARGGVRGDGQTSIVYNANTGEVAVDAPAGTELTSVNIDSAASIFTGAAAQNLGGSFDNDSDNNIFKATFGSSFGSLRFGNVAQPGLSEAFVLGDLTVVGSLAGGGALGNVDLIYVPEPSTVLLMSFGLVGVAGFALRARATQCHHSSLRVATVTFARPANSAPAGWQWITRAERGRDWVARHFIATRHGRLA